MTPDPLAGASSPSAHWVKRAIFAFGLSLCAATIFVLSSDVRQKIDAMAGARSDNFQWTLSQFEVEILAFRSALQDAQMGEADLKEVRRRFDILYSRLQTLHRSPLYGDIRFQEEVSSDLDDLRDFLARTVQIIDGTDSDLRSAIPGLEKEADQLRNTARRISLAGLDAFAERADQQREGVADTLARIAALTALMVVALLVLVVTLMRLNRLTRIQARVQAQTNSRLGAIVSTSLDAIIVVSRDGRVISFNGAAERIFGHTSEEVIGRDMGELIVPDHLRPAHAAGMKRYCETRERRVIGRGLFQLEAKRKDGTIFPVELSISTAESSDGEIFVSFIRDISARVAAEKELVEARDRAVAGEKAKAGLLAVMSHEMRTPLNGILGTLELLEDTELTDRQHRYVDIISGSGRLLLHHVNDVLDISRLDSGKADFAQEPFDLPSLLQEVLEGQMAVAEANGNQLTISTDSRLSRPVVGDPIRLRQVLLNLVGNAIKFTRNGEVKIHAERIGTGDVVEIRVRDTGIGIEPADLERIFEDFVTLDTSYIRKAGGTGLGLGIVRRIVRSMGGEIGVESAPGEGSLFWVRIPFAKPALDRDQPSNRSVRAPGVSRKTERMRVLVVEDNRINRIVAREMLEKEGHAVTEAHDGSEGVAFAEARPFDLILMDISMPEMDGVTATRTIRSGDGRNRATPIVALTAHAQPSDMARFEAAGMTDTLVKPISRSALQNLMARLHSPAKVAPDDEADDRGPLDRRVLGELRQQVGHDRFCVLLTDFIAETEEAIAALNAGMEASADHGRMAGDIHHLAGSAAVFGARSLQTELAGLERAVKAGELEAGGRLLEMVASTWTSTREALSQQLLADAPEKNPSFEDGVAADADKGSRAGKARASRT